MLTFWFGKFMNVDILLGKSFINNPFQFVLWLGKNLSVYIIFFSEMNFRMVILLLMESLGGCFGLGVSENIVCGSSIPTYVCLPRNYSSMDIPLTDEPNHIGKLYNVHSIFFFTKYQLDKNIGFLFSRNWNSHFRCP